MAARLQILTDLGSLDLPHNADEQFYVTRQIHDLQDFETKNADFTKVLKVPATPTNLEILDAYTGVADTVVSTIPCQIIMDGITIAPRAVLLFTKTIVNNQEIGFEVQILYGNFNLFENIAAGTIDEMNWADLAYDMAATTNLATVLSQNTTDLVTPLCDWVTRESVPVHETPSNSPTVIFEANIMGFFIYCKEIIKRIIEEAGFTVTYVNTPSDFDQIALAAPVTKRFQITSTDQLSFKNDVQTTLDRVISNGTLKVDWDNVINNSSGWFVPADDWWDIGTTGELKITVQGTFSHAETGVRPASEIRIVQNGGTIATFSTDQPEIGEDFFLTVSITAIAGDLIWVDIFSAVTQTTLTLEAGTFFSINTPGGDVDSTVQPSEWLPQISKNDFLANLLKLFNLVMQTNDVTLEVTIQPFDDVFDGAEQDLTELLDAGFNKIETQNSIKSLGQNSWFSWESDNLLRRDARYVIRFDNQLLAKEKDVISMIFSAADNSILHFDTATDTFLKAKMPSALVETAFTTTGGTAYPNINTDSLGNFSITDGDGTTPTWQVADYLGIASGFNGQNDYYRIIVKDDEVSGVIQGPIAARTLGDNNLITVRMLSAEEPEARLAIIRSDGGEANYNVTNGAPDAGAQYEAGSLTANWMDSLKMENITGVYYKNILDALKAPEVIKAWYNVPTALFVELDFLRPVYMANFNAFYYINKINQFKPDSKVQIELVRISNFE